MTCYPQSSGGCRLGNARHARWTIDGRPSRWLRAFTYNVILPSTFLSSRGRRFFRDTCFRSVRTCLLSTAGPLRDQWRLPVKRVSRRLGEKKNYNTRTNTIGGHHKLFETRLDTIAYSSIKHSGREFLIFFFFRFSSVSYVSLNIRDARNFSVFVARVFGYYVFHLRSFASSVRWRKPTDSDNTLFFLNRSLFPWSVNRFGTIIVLLTDRRITNSVRLVTRFPIFNSAFNFTTLRRVFNIRVTSGSF